MKMVIIITTIKIPVFNNSQPKLINDIDQLAQELGITVLHFIHLIKKI